MAKEKGSHDTATERLLGKMKEVNKTMRQTSNKQHAKGVQRGTTLPWR